jgi:hypothetical protein
MITSDDLEHLGWHHVGTSANGGSKEFCNRGRDQQNILPIYLMRYNGDNFIMKKNNDPKLTEITIKEIVINHDAADMKDKFKKVIHYTGYPTLDELQNEINKLKL